MSTTCRWTLVSLTSATTNTMMFSIYKKDHNKVCWGFPGRRIRQRGYKNPAGQHHVSPWFCSDRLHRVTSVGDFFFSYDPIHWLCWLLWDYFLKFINLQKHNESNLFHFISSHSFFNSSLNITFSEEPSLTINPHIAKLIGAIKHM